MLLAIWLLLALGGCGSDDLTSSQPVDPAARESAPAQAVLDWWARLGERNPRTVLAGLAPAARQAFDEQGVEIALAEGLARWARASEPTVLYVERRDGRVTVYMQIETGDFLGERLLKRETILLALPVARDRDGWLIDSSAWLESQVDSYVAAAAAPPDRAHAVGP